VKFVSARSASANDVASSTATWPVAGDTTNGAPLVLMVAPASTLVGTVGKVLKVNSQLPPAKLTVVVLEPKKSMPPMMRPPTILVSVAGPVLKAIATPSTSLRMVPELVRLDAPVASNITVPNMRELVTVALPPFALTTVKTGSLPELISVVLPPIAAA